MGDKTLESCVRVFARSTDNQKLVDELDALRRDADRWRKIEKIVVEDYGLSDPCFWFAIPNPTKAGSLAELVDREIEKEQKS